MKTTLLKFISLPEVAQFLKQTQPDGYLLNTLEFTITARFSKEEIDAAVEQWNARLMNPACESKRTLAAFSLC